MKVKPEKLSLASRKGGKSKKKTLIHLNSNIGLDHSEYQ